LKTLLNWHKKNNEKRLYGRYILSVENKPIHTVTIGTGKTKILLWSQMHGNESTTTKALFDLFLAFQETSDVYDFTSILSSCTLCIIPILNPDGAAAYTRVNANSVDLNRDAQNRSQPESKLLWKIYTEFKPDFCFNLHGQRTIFGFEDTGKPSILSFLAPSANVERSATLSRKRSMQVIAHIHNMLFMAIVAALEHISSPVFVDENMYFTIPEHQKCYCDILFKNSLDGDIGIQYKEKLTRNTIAFIPEFSSKDTTSSMFGHRVIDASGLKIKKLLEEKVIGKPDIRHLTLDEGFTINGKIQT